ncbi:hypothetical protein M9434_007015 [Picochlorum sp. BPE23]|nr:hypothetical protein M9434_007015 [Picochlorum sp. BPE23]
MSPSGKKEDDRVIIGEKGVSYGLQIRKPVPGRGRQPPTKPAKKTKNIFGDDDDEDDIQEGEEKRPMSHVGRMIAQQAAAAKTNKKVLEMQAEALQQDANIFDYDSHFDSIQQARSAPKIDEKVSRQPKYIANLLETAEHRKREQDVLYEKRLEKERKAEEHIYGTTEKFVTSAYRKKLEEEQKWKLEQEKKQREEEQEAVEKKGHMGDFYRNLFKSNVDFIGSSRYAEETKSKEQGMDTSGAVDTRDAHHMKEERAPDTVSVPAATIESRERDERRGGDTSSPREPTVAEETPSPVAVIEKEEEKEKEEERADRLKREREEKIKAAKERYLARKKIKE